MISALVTRDWLDFINRCTVDSWKEALVAALKHSDRKVVDICERLGDRLLEERAQSIDFIRNAMLCYVCAGSIDKLVSAWHQLKALEHQNNNYKPNTAELQELAEIVMLMSKSLEQQGIALELNGRFADFITEYGGLLVAQGALTAALAYIYALGSGNDEQNGELMELRERIYNTVNYRPMSAAATGRVANQQQQAPVARGSFSHGLPHAGYGGTNQFGNNQAGNWNTTALPTPSGSAAILQQTPLFNPIAATPSSAVTAKPPLAVPGHITNDALNTQPPRPASNASSQGGSGINLHSRSKYVLDPSVASAGPMGGYGGGYQPQVAAPAPAAIPTFNAGQFNASLVPTPAQPSLMQPAAPYNMGGGAPAPYGLSGSNNYAGGLTSDISNQQPQPPPPPTQSLPRSRTPPPGWNDPPALKSTRAVR